MRLLLAIAGVAVVALVAAGLLISNGDGGDEAKREVIRLEGRDPITGKQVSLDDYEGTPILLNIWASWCKPCNAEAEDVARFAAAHPEVQVIGLDNQDTASGARAFYRKWRWRHPSIEDKHGAEALRLGAPALPVTLFLDRDHRVVDRIIGPGTLEEFEERAAAIAAR